MLFTPKMLHTKLIMSEKTVSFGSANITKKAFSQLDELNFSLPHTADGLCTALASVMDTELAAAEPIARGSDIPYRPLIALFEGFIV